MLVNKRSKRQIESLVSIREWHLTSALRAQAEGRREQAQFHMNYYRLLEPAVSGQEAGRALEMDAQQDCWSE
ncbi:hypothetical protein ACIQAL_30855 [Pseudomonas sp. NPDC088368]|uniref:hypothetical protein n=1 Tax=Pseudomonas sp. NPDC088368 TaxID=3364453 RepID=UPI0038181E46